MKTMVAILGFAALSPALYAEDKDVWYDARGEVVAVTPAEQEKERFVPFWEKREIARAAERAARRDGRVRHSRVQRHYDHGYPIYSGWYGGCSRFYRGGHWLHGSRHYGTRWRFSGIYRGNGWSVRLNY